jgi:hypothetical protein
VMYFRLSIQHGILPDERLFLADLPVCQPEYGHDLTEIT